jgi:hypothetical protein
MKTKRFLVLFIFYLLKQQAFSFEKEKDYVPKIKKNSFYVEFLGAGIIGSINYERSFRVNKNTFFLSLGTLYIPRKKIWYQPSKYLFVPLKFSMEIGKKQHFYPSIGLLFEDGFEYYVPSAASLNYNVNAFYFQKSAVLYINCSPVNYRFNFNQSTFLALNFYVFKRIFYFNQNIDKLKYNYKLYPFIGIQLGKKF